MKKRLFGSIALASSLFVGGVASGAAATTGNQIRSTYIVVFRGGANAQAEAASLRGQGFEVRHVYEHVFQGLAVNLPEAAARGLANNPNVSIVEPDGVVTVSATQTSATWGIDRTDQRSLPLNGSFIYPDSAGSNVSAYIIDTGILTSHSEFTGRTGTGFTAIADSYGTTDCHGHGTHVAGTVAGTKYGLAKKARVVPVRVLDCRGSGLNSGVIAGVDWVAANAVKPAVANMSLGGGFSSALNAAVQNLHNSGVTVVVAAGNENADACSSSPASTPVAVTVGATTNTDARASYSNFGSCLDIFAPGSSITSAYITGSSATATMSGTSMASPHVAGAAALLLGANPSLTPTQVRDALVNAATTGIVSSAGTGSVNRLLYVSADGGSTSPTTTVAPTTTTLAPALTPGAFSKSTPTNTATNVSRTPTLTWTASANATSYQICLSTASTCSSWTSVGLVTSVKTSSLRSRTVYYWQVRAVNAAGTVLASEGVWRFTTAR